MVILSVFVCLACSRDSLSPDEYYNRGIESFRKGDNDSAIADYTKAIRLDQNNATYYNSRSFAYLEIGDYDRAIADATEAIRLASYDYEKSYGYNNRGLVYNTIGDYDRAIDDATEAIRLNSNYANPYRLRVVANIQKGNLTQARADIDRALQIDPSNEIAKNLDVSLKRLGSQPSAPTQQTAQAIQPSAPTAAQQVAQREADLAYENWYNSFMVNSEDDFEVRQNSDNTITIIGYKGSRKDVVIPGTLYGLRVTVIGNEAFQDKNLTSVVIPNTVVTIGDYAFYVRWHEYRANYNDLTEVVIPNSVIEIGWRAFQNSGIAKLTLGTGVQTIYKEAFSYNKLTELNLPTSLKTIHSSAFEDNQIKSLTIPNNVIYIGSDAFRDNPIEILSIPASLAAERTNTTGLGTDAFSQSEYGYHTVNKTITRINMPVNMVDRVLGSLGFEESFVNFYKGQNKAAGTYVKNGPIWRRQ